MKHRILSHPLIHTLINLQGNARGAVFTEPLWGIPFYLYAPYVSVYMLSLGLRDSQIGLVASINMGLQVFWSLVGGAITDRMGRKLTTFVFDAVSWSIPCLIWAAAQDIRWFVVAAIFNSVWRVTHTSWTCLWVEDTKPNLLLDIYTWIYISGLLAAFFSPLAGLLIRRFSLVPTVRALYIFSFVMMTVKFVVMNMMVKETERGRIRMEETRHQSFLTILAEYRGVGQMILKSPITLYTLAMMLITSIYMAVNSNFWSVLVTQKIMIADEDLAVFPFARAVTQLIFFFAFMPFIRKLNFRNPIIVGLAGFILGQFLLIIAPQGAYWMVMLSVIIEAASAAAVNNQVDRMFAVNIDEAERARVMSVMMMVMVGLTSPFTYIAGQLSEINRLLPFISNIFLMIGGIIVVWQAARYASRKEAESCNSGVE